MKQVVLLTIGLLLGLCATLHADPPRPDYGDVRGVCHTGWAQAPDVVERELGYAQRLQLNSTRIWLGIKSYEADPAGYVEKLLRYVRAAHARGMSVMPILFNGNWLNPDTLRQDFRPRGDAYVKAIVDALKDEPGLFIWDVMNEPTWNDYLTTAPSADRPVREEQINQFVRHYAKLVKTLDPKTATTIGHTFANDLKMGGDLVDVLSFHDYFETTGMIESTYKTAERYAKQYNKPLINSELGCVARANPYDVALGAARRHKVGWYVFELMIKGYWSSIHGLVYADGTVRDPAIIAAIYGFERNRDEATMIKEDADREGRVTRAVKQIDDALAAYPADAKVIDRLLDNCEFAVHLLEAAQLVPMRDPPSARLATFRKTPAGSRDVAAVRTFAVGLRDELIKVRKTDPN